MFNKLTIVFLSYCFCMSGYLQTVGAEEVAQSPPGICVFDIDSTLTEPGSMSAVKTCVELGFGLGINTGEDKGTAQNSMNAIYNGLSQRGHSLDHLHQEGEIQYYDYIKSFHEGKTEDILTTIGDGSNQVSSTDSRTPALPGNVDKDPLFQYSGGCKTDATFTCTHYPYKHEGLESIAQYYYPDYVRSKAGVYPPAVSDERNECIILFDDQKTTTESFANNITEGGLGKSSKEFRAVYINEPGWTIDNPENAKETVCKVVKQLPVKCLGSVQLTTICDG